MTRPKVRISTLMLLVVIAALAVALMNEWGRSSRLLARAEAEKALARQEAAVARARAERALAAARVNAQPAPGPAPVAPSR